MSPVCCKAFGTRRHPQLWANLTARKLKPSRHCGNCMCATVTFLWPRNVSVLIEIANSECISVPTTISPARPRGCCARTFAFRKRPWRYLLTSYWAMDSALELDTGLLTRTYAAAFRTTPTGGSEIFQIARNGKGGCIRFSCRAFIGITLESLT